MDSVGPPEFDTNIKNGGGNPYVKVATVEESKAVFVIPETLNAFETQLRVVRAYQSEIPDYGIALIAIAAFLTGVATMIGIYKYSESRSKRLLMA